MKAKVTAKVKNSPRIPVKEIVAEEIIDFPDSENVFGRVLIFRQHYKKKFGENIDLDIQKVEWL